MLDDNNNYCSQKGGIHESKNIKTFFFSREKYDRKKRKNGGKKNNYALLLLYEYDNLNNYCDIVASVEEQSTVFICTYIQFSNDDTCFDQYHDHAEFS
jgi:hypothetical protein